MRSQDAYAYVVGLDLVAVSPDEEFIYFTTTNCDKESLDTNKIYKSYVIKKDGTGMKKIWDNAVRIFSPDFKSVLMYDFIWFNHPESKIESATLEIGTRNAEGTFDVSSLKLPEGFLPYEQFSPDGKYLQIYKKDDGVYNFDPQTGEIVGEKLLISGTLSPDRNKMFDRDLENEKWFIADSDGKNRHYLACYNNLEYKLVWSHDGMSLLRYVRCTSEDGEDCELDERQIQILQLNPERTELSNKKIVKRLVYGPSAIW
jgi:outer membrane protein assembly factor BamB